jgi:hypothetical protein
MSLNTGVLFPAVVCVLNSHEHEAGYTANPLPQKEAWSSQEAPRKHLKVDVFKERWVRMFASIDRHSYG